MASKLMSNVHFQLRLVKELRYSSGQQEIITDRILASPKEGKNSDHTLDLFSTEAGALNAARNYCKRSDKRKGINSDDYHGIVVTRFEDEASFTIKIPTTVPQRLIKGKNWGRPARTVGTTAWLYFVKFDSCKPYHVVTTQDRKHYIGKEVIL